MSCLNSFVGPQFRHAEEIYREMVLAECWNGVIFLGGSMLGLKTQFCSVPANDHQEFCTHLQHLRGWGRMKKKKKRQLCSSLCCYISCVCS